MTAIWREDRQPNFDPFGRSMRIVTPPNTPANASHCTSNAPAPPPFSILCLDPIPLLRPLGRSTEATVCTFPALIPSTVPRPRSYFNFKLTQQCGSCDPKTRWWPRLRFKRKNIWAGRWKEIHSPFIGRACLNPEFTGGNYLQSGIPKFPISVFPPLLVGRIPDFWIYHSPRRKGIRYKEGWWTSWRWWIWIWPRRTFRANVLEMSLSNLFPFYFNFFLQCNIYGQCPRIWRVKISWVQAGIKNYPMHVTVALL